MLSSYVLGLLTLIGINLLLALSVYVILATGQLSLGNGGFMALGAYGASVLTASYGVPLPFALLIAALGTGLVGVAVGYPALRLTGVYLAIATLGFGEIIRTFFLNFPVTGGAGGFHGMRIVAPGTVWLWAGGCFVAILLAEQSRLWLEYRAVRDDEFAAFALGLDPTSLKVGAFGVGAALAAIGGGLFAHYALYIEPGNFSFLVSIEMVLFVILGGSETVWGPLVGAIAMTVLPEMLRFVGNWRDAVFGAMLIVILWVRREGLVSGNIVPRIVRRERKIRATAT
jgi:branched-chain amino acid transport system permease protein